MRVTVSPEAGKGLVAGRTLRTGETIWKEGPLVWVLPLEVLRMGRGEFCAFCGKVFVGSAGKALRVECRECHHGNQPFPFLPLLLFQAIYNGRYVLLPYTRFILASAHSLLAFYIVPLPFRCHLFLHCPLNVTFWLTCSLVYENMFKKRRVSFRRTEIHNVSLPKQALAKVPLSATSPS